jgi:hypothetical protein
LRRLNPTAPFHPPRINAPDTQNRAAHAAALFHYQEETIMRKLKTSDIPVLCRCIKKLGVKDQIRAIALESDTAKDVWDRGFDFIWGLFDIATEQAGENCIYEFLAGPFEMTPDEVRDLDLNVMYDNMQKLIAENNLGVFFSLAAKSMKSN